MESSPEYAYSWQRFAVGILQNFLFTVLCFKWLVNKKGDEKVDKNEIAKMGWNQKDDVTDWIFSVLISPAIQVFFLSYLMVFW